MDENKITTAETEEVSDATRAAIDEYWPDDETELTEDYGWGGEDDGQEEPEATDPDAQPEDVGDGDAEEAGVDTGAEQPDAGAEAAEPEGQPEAGNQRFKLKFLGEEKEVDLDEMTTLAQKGADYDHVREDRDGLRTENQKLKGYEDFVKELAESLGNVSVEELMESSRANMLMQKAQREGRELSESEARTAVRAKAAEKAAPTGQPSAEQRIEQAQREAVEKFRTLYPNVRSEDIPAEVWQEANAINDLVGPYQKHLAAQKDAEVERLKAEVQQLKQNRINEQRSTGSRKSAGVSQKSKVDEAWEASLKDNDW